MNNSPFLCDFDRTDFLLPSFALKPKPRKILKALLCKDRLGESYALGGLGSVYNVLGKYDKAIEYYLQRLANARGNGDREDEGATLVALGKVYKKLGKNELAIDYYTRSVKVRESFRQDIRKFDKGAQQFYLNTISSDYKALADLLIQQGRNLEAQQILALLKVN